MSSRVKATYMRPAVIALSFAVLVFAAVLAAVPAHTEAASHTKDVRGYAYDHAYRKIPNALITVSILNPGNTVVKSESTDSDGFYNLHFESSEWDIGVTIRVVATYNSQQSDPNETACNNGFLQWVNATAFEFEIPQFGSTVGLFLTAGIIGAVAVTVLFWKRR